MNAYSPILSTLSGILMVVRDLQHSNVEISILVTPSGILMVVRDLQSKYLQSVITQYFASNKSEIWS